MGAIKVGTTDISAVYVGTTAVSKIYVGTTEVWPTAVATFSISPSSLSLGNSSGTTSLSFSYGVTDYAFTSAPGWCTVSTVTSSGKVTGLSVAYTANSDNSSRSGSIKFVADGASREVSVSQAASSVVAVTGVSLNQSSISLYSGSTQQLTATITPANATNQNVTWSSSDTSVATVSSSGLVTAVSTGTASITVTTSDGGYMDYCNVSVATASLSVNTNSLSWTASQYDYLDYKDIIITSNVSWTMTLTGSNFTTSQGTSYNGSGNKTISVYPTSQNGTTSERTAQISISATGLTTQTISLTQAGVVATLSVSPTDLTFEYDQYGSSGQKSFAITSNQSWEATIPSNATFTFSNGTRSTSGTGNATVYVRPTSRNTGTTDRTATISLKNTAETLTASVGLVQYSQSYSLSVIPTSLTFNYDDDTYAEGKSVTVTADHSWSASIQSGDFLIGNPGSTSASGSSGTSTLVVYPSSTNSGSSDKTGLLRVTGTGSGYVRDVDLTQEYNPALDVSVTDALSFAGTGSTETITITGTVTSWQITSAPSWCSYASSTGTSSTIAITAGANNTGDARIDTIELTINGISGYIVSVDQPDASSVTYTFSISATPSDATVIINSVQRTSYSCPAGTSISWSVSKSGYTTQTGTYTMTAANHTETVTLAVNYTLSVSPNSLTFDYDKYGYVSGSKLVTITSNQSWTMTATGVFRIGSSAATTASGSGNGSYSIFPNSTNTGSSARTGTLTITGANSGSATVSLTQNYNTTALQSISIDGPDTLDINDASAYIEVYTPSGTSQTGVTWSITSGSSYCTGTVEDVGGDGDSFVLRPTSSAYAGATITIRCQSTVNSSIYATKTITVVDELGPAVEPIDSVTVSGSDTIYTLTNQATYTATVLPATAEDKSVTWSVTGSDSSKCSINQSGVVTVKSTATYLCEANVVATSNADPSVSGSLTILFKYRT